MPDNIYNSTPDIASPLPTLAPAIDRWSHQRSVAQRWRELGGAPKITKREGLRAARYLLNNTLPERPRWLGITAAPPRWTRAYRLVADIAHEIVEGADLGFYGQKHLDLELSLIGLFVARRQHQGRRCARCHSRIDQ
jgi:hypothetical protein